MEMKENFTIYEWDVELVDEYEDVLDHDFSEKCPGIPTQKTFRGEEGEYEMLVLVKNVYRQWDLSDRTWAYVKEGKLPEYFSDAWQREASKVPKRFHKELFKKELMSGSDPFADKVIRDAINRMKERVAKYQV